LGDDDPRLLRRRLRGLSSSESGRPRSLIKSTSQIQRPPFGRSFCLRATLPRWRRLIFTARLNSKGASSPGRFFVWVSLALVFRLELDTSGSNIVFRPRPNFLGGMYEVDYYGICRFLVGGC
jgi:hypothetical protein